MANLLRQVPNSYEPKLTNRFMVTFPNELDMGAWLVQEIKRPGLDIDLVEIPYINTKSYVAGKYSWGEGTIQFLDLIGPSTSMKLMEWVRLSTESLTGRMGYASGYQKDLFLSTLDPTGIEVEKFGIFQTTIKKIEWPTSSYGESNLILPEITYQAYFCELLY
jgi:hypothetical protein